MATPSRMRTPSRRATLGPGPPPSHQKLTSSRRLSIGGSGGNVYNHPSTSNGGKAARPPRLSTAGTAGSTNKNKRASMIPRIGRENAAPSTPSNRHQQRQQQHPPPPMSSSVAPRRRSSLGGAGAGGGVPPATPSTQKQYQPRASMSSRRRSSIGVGGGSNRRKSLLPPGAGGSASAATAPAIKDDPRPVHDKAFQKQCISRLFRFLVDSGYPNPIAPKSLLRPSSKDFANIVTYMLRMVDPNFQKFVKESTSSGATNHNNSHHPALNMKLEDEICLNFKCLGYPYNLSKTALVAAGSPNAWPGLLAALAWLMEHLEMLSQVQPEDYLRCSDADNKPFESIADLETRTDRAFFQYLHETYQAWMANDAEREAELQDDLLLRFESDNKLLDAEIERTTDLNAAIVERMQRVREEMEALSEYSKKREDYATTLEQLYDLTHKTEEQKAVLEKKVREKTTELTDANGKLERTNINIAYLKTKIEAQAISVNDVLRMESESKGIAEAMDRLDAADEKRRHELLGCEHDLRQRSDECESVIGQYNSKLVEAASAVGSEESAPASSKLVNFKASLQLDRLLSSNLGDVLGASIDDQVLPAIAQAHEELVDQTSTGEKRYEDALDALARSNEQLNEALVQKQILQDKIAKCEETLQHEEDAHEAKLGVHQRELQVLEGKVASMRDPVQLEEQKLAYERQLAELEVLQSQHREDTVAKKRAVQVEIESGCQLMTEHERHYHLKMEELEGYWRKKEAGIGRVKVPDDLGLED